MFGFIPVRVWAIQSYGLWYVLSMSTFHTHILLIAKALMQWHAKSFFLLPRAMHQLQKRNRDVLGTKIQRISR